MNNKERKVTLKVGTAMFRESEILVTVDDTNKRAVRKRHQQKLLKSEPTLFGDQKVRKPVPTVTKKVLAMKDSRSSAVRKHLEEEENTGKQLANFLRVVKVKKPEGAVTKNKNSLVENLKRKESEPGTPNAKDHNANKTLQIKEPDSGAGSSKYKNMTQVKNRTVLMDRAQLLGTEENYLSEKKEKKSKI